MRKSTLVPTALLCVATVAYPCGGSQVDFVDGPLVSPQMFAERALMPMVDYDVRSRDEMRFLPGLLRADSARMVALVNRPPWQEGWPDTSQRPVVPEPDERPLERALAAGALEDAVRLSHAIVERVMALPSSDDSARTVALRTAVETIELAPMLAAVPVAERAARFTQLAAPFRGVSRDSLPPRVSAAGAAARRASLDYAALQQAIRTRIPDGDRDAIGKAMERQAWDSLHAMQRAWLQHHAAHPYAGLVQFLRVRLFFLASQADSAWHSAIALYPSYPVRAAGEMVYLLRTGVPVPAGLIVDPAVPVELRVSLVGNVRPTAAEWDTLMRLSQREPRAPWAENLQERLLGMLASDTAAVRVLPSAFPAWRPSASLLWRRLFAICQLRAGQPDRALPFARSFTFDARDSLESAEAATLATRIHLQRGDWLSALQVRGVDDWTKRYLLRVLAPDTVVTQLVRSRDRVLGRDARLILANRAATAGRWADAAAMVQPIDVPRAVRYTRIGTLSADTTGNAGLLRFARALGAANGALFFESRRYFFRGMVAREWSLSPDRDDPWDLPWSRDDERRKLYRYFRQSAERFVALRAYASLLRRPGLSAAERQTAVREANAVYRGLLATDPSRVGDGYWGDSLPRMPEAAVIRAAGRQR
jgi:hypothetical protein